MNKDLEKLIELISSQSEWEIAGEPRMFNYNGPYTTNKWNEVHIPIKLKE